MDCEKKMAAERQASTQTAKGGKIGSKVVAMLPPPYAGKARDKAVKGLCVTGSTIGEATMFDVKESPKQLYRVASESRHNAP